MSKFPEVQALLEGNRQWAEAVDAKEPEFFAKSAKGQYPKFLWYGCGDSRVPESVILAQKPGEIFVHRNVANQIRPDDDSALSVLEFAVQTVGITHIIVAGHSQCGACIVAHGTAPPDPSAPATDSTPLSRFLKPVIDLRHSLPKDVPLNHLIEENVKVGIRNLMETEVIKTAWAKHAKGEFRPIYIHGWVHDLGTGRVRDLEISQGPGLSNKM